MKVEDLPFDLESLKLTEESILVIKIPIPSPLTVEQIEELGQSIHEMTNCAGMVYIPKNVELLSLTKEDAIYEIRNMTDKLIQDVEEM